MNFEAPQSNKSEKPIGVEFNEINKDYSDLEIFINEEIEPSSGDMRRALEVADKMRKIIDKMGGNEEQSVIENLKDRLSKLEDFIDKNKNLI